MANSMIILELEKGLLKADLVKWRPISFGMIGKLTVTS